MDERSVGGRRAGRVGEVAPRMTRPSPQLARIAELERVYPTSTRRRRVSSGSAGQSKARSMRLMNGTQ